MSTSWCVSLQTLGTQAEHDALRRQVGESALARARLLQAGLPVPESLVISAAAIEAHAEHYEIAGEIAREVLAKLPHARLLRVRPSLAFTSRGLPAPVGPVGTCDAERLGFSDRVDSAWADLCVIAARSWADSVCGIGPARLRGIEAGEAAVQRLALEKRLAEWGASLPTSIEEELARTLDALFRAARSQRANYYRHRHGLSRDQGIALMVEDVAVPEVGENVVVCGFDSRNAVTGERGVRVESVRRAGEPSSTDETAYSEELADFAAQIERVWRAPVHAVIERTGARWDILDTTKLTSSAQASLRIAVDLVEDGVLTKAEALCSVNATSFETVLRPTLVAGSAREVISRGVAASPGVVSGRVVFHADELKSDGGQAGARILVRMNTTTEDLQAFSRVSAVLTMTGGETSHAAVVARDRGIPCVVGCSGMRIDEARKLLYAGDRVIHPGDLITVDGHQGTVFWGAIETEASPHVERAFHTLLDWSAEVGRLAILGNADSAADARRAKEMGAAGIGLCRSEHIFFDQAGLLLMRNYLLAEDERARRESLSALEPHQRGAFADILRTMGELPVCIRLLDPPLSVFLPKDEAGFANVARQCGVETERVRGRARQLAEVNAGLGHRGARLGITHLELYRAQTRAIIDAAIGLLHDGVRTSPEIMIPLVATTTEAEHLRSALIDVVQERCRANGVSLDVPVGVMIETPRACLLAAELAAHVDFFSFGTNDLTQFVWGMSRDDMSGFSRTYTHERLWAQPPTHVFDEQGVGELVELAVTRGRVGNAHLRFMVCGEHAAEPRAIAYFQSLGMDGLSCSPFRIPVARLAAAQAVLRGVSSEAGDEVG